MSEQPEALRLADWLQAAVQTYPQISEDEPGGYCTEVDQVMDDSATELRRQHAEIEALRAEVACEEKRFNDLTDLFAELSKEKEALRAELAKLDWQTP